MAAPSPLQNDTRRAIAVVENDPGVLAALQDWLQTLPQYQGSFHSSATSLLAQLQARDGGWCLAGPEPLNARLVAGAVLDLNLPGMGGFELARRLRARAPNLPVVVITAASADTQALHGGAPPGVSCLQKPFNLDALEQCLFSHGRP